MVFSAGFGTWYMLKKGPGRGQEQDIATLVHRDDNTDKDAK
jgi:hypothetical protein